MAPVYCWLVYYGSTIGLKWRMSWRLIIFFLFWRSLSDSKLTCSLISFVIFLTTFPSHAIMLFSFIHTCNILMLFHTLYLYYNKCLAKFYSWLDFSFQYTNGRLLFFLFLFHLHILGFCGMSSSYLPCREFQYTLRKKNIKVDLFRLSIRNNLYLFLLV